MTEDSSEPGHGNSPAAWTAVIIMLAAVGIGTLFFFLDIPAVVIASAVLLVIGLIVGVVLSKAGYGVNGPKTFGSPKDH